MLLTRVLKVFGTVAASNTNDTLQETQRDRGAEARRAQRRDLSRTTRCIGAFESSTSTATTLGLSPEKLDIWSSAITSSSSAPVPAVRERTRRSLRALNQEESTLTTEFQNATARRDEGRRAWSSTIRSELDGLSDADRRRGG